MYFEGKLSEKVFCAVDGHRGRYTASTFASNVLARWEYYIYDKKLEDSLEIVANPANQDDYPETYYECTQLILDGVRYTDGELEYSFEYNECGDIMAYPIPPDEYEFTSEKWGKIVVVVNNSNTAFVRINDCEFRMSIDSLEDLYHALGMDISYD